MQAAGIDNVMIIRSNIEREVTHFRVHLFLFGLLYTFCGVSFVGAMINFNSADWVVRRHVLKPNQTFSLASALLPRPLPPSSLSLSLCPPHLESPCLPLICRVWQAAKSKTLISFSSGSLLLVFSFFFSPYLVRLSHYKRGSAAPPIIEMTTSHQPNTPTPPPQVYWHKFCFTTGPPLCVTAWQNDRIRMHT